MANFDFPNFDKLIQDIGSRYHLGAKGHSLIEEAVDFIAEEPGGVGGFLAKFRTIGLDAEVNSWLEGGSTAPLSGQQIEQALGSEAIAAIADRAGVSERFARTVLGYAVPKIIGRLARSGFLAAATAAASTGAAASGVDEVPQFGPDETEEVKSVPWYRRILAPGVAGVTFGQLAIPGAAFLIVLGLFGYFASLGNTHSAATKSAPVIAKNVPALVPSSPPVKVHQAAIISSTGAAKSAPAVIPKSPSTPARLALSNENGNIVYSGIVDDDAMRAVIIDSLKTVFGADKISGNITVDKNAGPANWTKDLTATLGNFKTPGSQALFAGNNVSVGTTSAADRDKILRSLVSTLGPKFVYAPMTVTGEPKTAIASQPLKSEVIGKQPVGVAEQSALNLPTIYFGTNSAEVPTDSKSELERAAAKMEQLPAGTMVQIGGFTDTTGNPAANLKLSQERANAVRAVLVEAGVNPAILSAKGYGIYHSSTNQNETIEGRSSSANKDRLHEERRVELRLAQK
jgi:OmpA-OmpF porin, OOP family